eukprot:CAMPEP_0174348070 /NCGR_PEP_ID=MMETSP0811_2-20130205/4400_1 /TAXON_ID=73025 ORGANISM="Eutreptiella gymnastica-like, Strain CCMP1594" /NCGR_SAMPLE_ID=MMETSP0811_2 /ASSEMBLY_ACC=CAM_ASM_000667 /LENGTH=103 /DNA_ID=CAMNT_0015474269 /DNA_START=686 /DNA_END=998 /DNA_ORIENTATION=-
MEYNGSPTHEVAAQGGEQSVSDRTHFIGVSRGLMWDDKDVNCKLQQKKVTSDMALCCMPSWKTLDKQSGLPQSFARRMQVGLLLASVDGGSTAGIDPVPFATQ